jgi:hypothetical protein
MIDQKITFSIQGKEYTIGTITIGQYYEIYSDIERDDIEAHFSIVQTLSGCPNEHLKTLKTQDWGMLWASLVGMLNSYFAQDTQKITQEFTHSGVKYGLVDMDTMTIGEFADLDIICNSNQFSQKYHEMLAILYRPIVKKGFFSREIIPYSQINFREQSELFKSLPLYYIKSAISFFLLSANQSLNNTKIYLENQIQTLNLSPDQESRLRKAVLELQETGGDLLTASLTKTHLDFVKLPSLTSEKDSTGSRGNKTRTEKRKKQFVSSNTK